jgi:hypothetical protein
VILDNSEETDNLVALRDHQPVCSAMADPIETYHIMVTIQQADQ